MEENHYCRQNNLMTFISESPSFGFEAATRRSFSHIDQSIIETKVLSTTNYFFLIFFCFHTLITVFTFLEFQQNKWFHLSANSNG
jgi:hypothetical protein